MPTLVRFFLHHGLAGFALGAGLVGVIVATDALGLRSLAGAAEGGWLGLAILAVLMGTTFGGVQTAFAVMLLAHGAEAPGDGADDRAPPHAPHPPGAVAPALAIARRR